MRAFLELLQNPWYLLIIGYLITINIETPILYFGLSPQHSWSRRVIAGAWLTACTYPLVILVVPEIFNPTTARLKYLLVAESIAHFGECVLFYVAFAPLAHFWRDMAAVFTANLASFGFGELLWHFAEWYLETFDNS